MGVGTDFYLFSITGILIIFLFRYLKYENYWSIFSVLSATVAAFYVLQGIDAPDYKRLLIFYPILLALILSFRSLYKSKKSSVRYSWLLFFPLFAILPFLYSNIEEWLRHLLGPQFYLQFFISNIFHISYGELIATFVRTLSGTLITNKAALIPGLMYLQVIILLWLSYKSVSYLRNQVRSDSTFFIELLVISIPIGMLLVGAILNNFLWVFPRYTYPIWGALFFAISYWAASDMKNLRVLATIAFVGQFLAVTTMFIPNYYMKLGYYP